MAVAMENVCRLCLTTDDLVYIFDEKNKKLKMKDVISITTGIEIHEKDIISQKVCGKCYQFIIQIFQFRSQCLKSDKYLKDLCMDYLVDKKYYIPNTEVSIKCIVKSEEIPKIKPNMKTASIYKVHPSVIKLSRTYPEIKLPRSCLTSNVAPIVQMEIDQVENYFNRLKLDFNLHVKKALFFAKQTVIPTFSRIQKSSKQTKILNLPNAIKITKISEHNEPNKTKKSNKDIANSNEERSNLKDVCKTPKKSPLKRNNKSAIYPNVNKRLVEISPKEKSHSKVEHLKTNTGSPNRKRKLVIEKYPKTDLGEKPLLSETDTYCSPSKRRRKHLTLENVTNKKVVDDETGPSKTTQRKSQHDSKRFDEKQCALREKLIDGQVKVANDKDGLGSRSPNKSSVNREESQLNENDECESLTSVGRSVSLFVCEICNSVQYNMYELKKHQNKHMRCQFCKIRFRSLENKRHHIENVCLIRKMMNDLPHVSLVKIERSEIIRQRYSEAFIGFSPVRSIDVINHEKISNIISVKKALFKDCPPERLDIIEILSDEEILSPPISDKYQRPIVPDISSNIFTSKNLNATKKELLKDLLAMFQRPSEEADTQTPLPSNCDINITENSEAVLKNLLPYMFMYNIPVKVQPGKFNVTFDYTVNSIPTKKLCLWDDLAPVSIKSRAEELNSSKVIMDSSK